MTSWLSGLRRSPILRILTGASLGQIITLMAMPLLLRIYDPAQYGVFTLVSAVALPLTAVLTLKYEAAVPLPRDEREACRLAYLALAASTTQAIILTGLLLLFTPHLIVALSIEMGDAQGLLGSLWLIPLVAWSSGVLQTSNALAVRAKRYRVLSARGPLLAVSTVGAQLAGAFLVSDGTGLIIGYIIGQTLTGAVLFSTGRHREEYVARGWWELARRYSRAPRHLMPAGVLNSLALQAPPLLIGVFFGVAATGQYGVAQRVVAAPVSLLTQSVSSVYLGNVASLSRESAHAAALALFTGTTKRLMLVGFVIGGCALLLGPWGLTLVFGSQWAGAGAMVQAMSLMLVAQIICSPLSHTMVAYERTRMLLLLDLMRIVLLVSAIAGPGFLELSVIVAIWILSVFSTITYAIVWLVSRTTITRVIEGTEERKRE